MKLSLRFLYLLPLLAVLFTNRALDAYAFGKEDLGGFEKPYAFALIAAATGAVAYHYRCLEHAVRWWLGTVLAVMGCMVLESYANWHSWMQYPHVFSKLTILLPLFGLYAFHRRYPQRLPYRQLVGVLLPALVGSLVLFYPEALSLGSFLETERGFSVTSAFLLTPLALLCLSWYLTSGGWFSGLRFLFCAALIVFLQHRTVWVCTALGVALTVALVAWRTPQARAVGPRLAALAGVALALATGTGLAVVLDNPDVVKKLAKSIADIENPTTQGTGTFRMQQYAAYLPLVRERPLAGWRWQGFEVPIQFYSDDSGEPVWPDFTGHHFHSFYLDRLFFFGGLGLLLVLLAPALLVLPRLFSSAPLAPETVALLAFGLTLPVFGLSYDWPDYAYGFLGVLLAELSAPPTPAPASPWPPLPGPCSGQ